MSRYDTVSFNPSLREVLDRRNADDLKRMLALIPGIALKAPRKGEIIETLVQSLLGPGLPELWNQLSALEQSAIAEATHSADGIFDGRTFKAKYGALPVFEKEGKHQWDRHPTLLRLFIHPGGCGDGSPAVPRDLREKLAAFVSEPPAANLKSLEQIPARAPREWTSDRFDSNQRTTVYDRHEAPLVERLTEQAAIQDLRTVLRLIDQEKLSVSEATLFPSKATMKLLAEWLRDHDFFELTEKVNDWDPEIGPVKAFSWPLLVQAAKLAAVRNGKLALTKRGRTALEAQPAHTLRAIWDAWRTNGILDEFNRIDTIKGQKGKGRRSFTPAAERRLIIRSALAECPIGQWVDVDEFSRFMRAAGFGFEVTTDRWSLYLCEQQYGSLGYDGHGGWNILQERYLLCLLLEYAAPLGIIDVAYEHPAGARTDYTGQWGADDLIFLSRYDGLRYFRVTPLGAFILGLVDTYEPRKVKPDVALTVLPGRKIRIDQGELSTDEILLFENFADQETAECWSFNEAKALQSIQKGARVEELRALLSACDPQPLPETVEGFLRSVQERGTACVFKGTCLLIECLSPEIAEAIARDPRAGALCQRTGDRGLVVPMDKEKAFRDAINALGFGMPRV